MKPLGDAGWRLDLPEDVDRAALLAALRRWPGVEDVVVAERHVAVLFDPARPPEDPRPVVERCRGVHHARSPRHHRIGVRYDGADLDELAAACGLTRDELIAAHARTTYTVRMIGFLPGFAYLGGLSPELVRPRRATPRPRVPAGSVGVAGPYTGIYPFESPGGWHLVGQVVGWQAFDLARGATLALGDQVAFVVVA